MHEKERVMLNKNMTSFQCGRMDMPYIDSAERMVVLSITCPL